MNFTKCVSKKNKLITGILILAIVIFLFFEFLCIIPENVYKEVSGPENAFIGEVVRGKSIEQEIPYHGGERGVSLKFATYRRKNHGRVKITIRGSNSGFEYVNQDLSADLMKDNTYIDFMYAEDRPMEDETLLIKISSTCRPGQGVTIAIVDSDVLPDHSLKIEGKTTEKDLAVRTIVTSQGRRFAMGVFLPSIICVIVILIYAFNEHVRLERAFFVVALLLGLVYSLVITPLSVPDEYYHYHSAFRMSNVLCCQWNDLGTADVSYFDFRDISANHNTPVAYNRICYELFTPLPKSEGERAILGGSIGYPFMIIPPAIGLSIGRILGANFLLTYYLGRLTNLLFFIGCVTLAIKNAPRFKLLFFMIGIMPMALHQAASYSYDAYSNGMAVLLVALILKAIDGKGILHFKELLPVIITGVLLAPAKNVYSPMLLLLFLIPQNRFKSKKQYFFTVISILLCAAAFVLLFQMRAIVDVASQEGTGLNWEGGINYTLKDVLQNPAKFTDMFANTFYVSIWGWYVQCIGKLFSGLTIINNDCPIIVYAILMLISSFRYEGEKAITGVERFGYLFTCLITIFFVMLVMLLAWTSNTRDTIAGIQGRYFIPVISLFYMSLNNRLVTIHKPIERYISVSGVLINLYILEQVMLKTMML